MVDALGSVFSLFKIERFAGVTPTPPPSTPFRLRKTAEYLGIETYSKRYMDCPSARFHLVLKIDVLVGADHY